MNDMIKRVQSRIYSSFAERECHRAKLNGRNSESKKTSLLGFCRVVTDTDDNQWRDEASINCSLFLNAFQFEYSSTVICVYAHNHLGIDER